MRRSVHRNKDEIPGGGREVSRGEGRGDVPKRLSGGRSADSKALGALSASATKATRRICILAITPHVWTSRRLSRNGRKLACGPVEKDLGHQVHILNYVPLESTHRSQSV